MHSITKTVTLSKNINIKNMDSYMKNPVILYNHDCATLPIGRTIKIDNDLYTLRFNKQLLDERKITFEQLQFYLENEGVRFEPSIDQNGNLIEISLVPNIC